MFDTFAITITTKDKCHDCPNDFDNELHIYLKSKGVDVLDFWYKLEYAKFTKWHCHGLYIKKWDTSPDDKFYAYFKVCTDVAGWMGYSEKDQREFHESNDDYIEYLDDGVFLKE